MGRVPGIQQYSVYHPCLSFYNNQLFHRCIPFTTCSLPAYARCWCLNLNGFHFNWSFVCVSPKNGNLLRFGHQNLAYAGGPLILKPVIEAGYSPRFCWWLLYPVFIIGNVLLFKYIVMCQAHPSFAARSPGWVCWRPHLAGTRQYVYVIRGRWDRS